MEPMIRARAGPPPRGFEDLHWLIDVLWGRDGARARVIRGGKRKSGGGGSWAVVPHADRPRFLVPLADRRAAAASVTLFNRLRPPRTRVARRMLGGLLGAGLGSLVARDRVEVATEEPDLDPIPLGSLLRRTFGRDDLTVAVGVGGSGPNRKPTLQVMSLAGEPLGFAKLGWSASTRDAVRNEAAALTLWEEREPTTFAVPALIHGGTYQGLEVSLAAPLPRGARRHDPRAGAPPAAVTLEVADVSGLSVEALGTSRYWNRMAGRIDEATSGLDLTEARALRSLVHRLEDEHGGETMSFGSWHGDWSPWNMAWSRGRLFVLDWEHWNRCVPKGLDLLHYHFQVAFHLQRRSVSEAIGLMDGRTLPLLRSLDVSPRQAEATREAYLLEVVLRAEDRRRAGAGVAQRLHPQMLAWVRSHARA